VDKRNALKHIEGPSFP